MKKCISLILAFALVIGIFVIAPITPVANATSVDVLTFALNEDGQSYSVVGHNLTTETELVIPSTYNDLPVTSIGSHAFEDCIALTSVMIPDGITNIGDYAFNACNALTSVTIGDGVTTIGEGAFYYCVVLTSITIPDSVTSIGESAFGYCYDLANVTLGNGITSLSNLIFADCSSLTSITIPDSVTTIGAGAFYECIKLTNITIPDKVTSIGEAAFYYCRDLISITLPDSVTSIGDKVFLYCYSLTSVTIPDSVTNIGDYAFNCCYYLASITIPDSVTSIGRGAFFGTAYYEDTNNWENDVLYIGNYLIRVNTTLSNECDIKSGTKVIADSAFSSCSLLTSLTIPDSVTSIGENTFTDCSSLKYAFYTGSSDDWSNISIGEGNESLTSQPIHYNSTEHTHNVTTRLPISADDEGVKEDICPVCNYVNSSEKLLWVNNYITAVDTKDVVVDTTSNTMVLDISASKDLNEAIIEMDGYALSSTPNSAYGYYGTGSKVQVLDDNGVQVDEYTLVVRGDVNGDSVCDVIDCMLLELAKNDHTELAGIYLTAADLTENGDIDVDDFEAVVNKAIA